MDHRDALEKLCRVCGRHVVTKSVKVKHLCADCVDKLETVFRISTSSDDANTHPWFFCHSCKIVLLKASSTAKSYQHRTIVFGEWCSHNEGSCSVCQHYQMLQQGGRPKKVKRMPGRPPSISPRYCIDHIRDVAPPPLVPLTEAITVCEHHQHLSLPELMCPICSDILRCPVELVTCGSVVCAECICSWLHHKGELECPCCYNDHLREYTAIRQATALLLRLLGSLCVICSRCQSHVHLDVYNDHISSNCTTHYNQVSPETIVEDVINQPLTAPLTPIEQKLQTSLARRSISGSPEESILQIKTGGRVRHNSLDTV